MSIMSAVSRGTPPPSVVPEDPAPDLYAAVKAMTEWLDEHNGFGLNELTLRALKVTEEAGEAAAALIGYFGQNPRKGQRHTPTEVAEELADVVMAALVAIASLGVDPQPVIQRLATRVLSRVGGVLDD